MTKKRKKHKFYFTHKFFIGKRKYSTVFFAVSSATDVSKTTAKKAAKRLKKIGVRIRTIKRKKGYTVFYYPYKTYKRGI